ncbi:response regulator transcription factor [Acetobacter papayae]|uniref:response regulator transcription factor n=1 Tax=Acetobacter papayae TaxID=1076592 RepID=UPI0039E974FD
MRILFVEDHFASSRAILSTLKKVGLSCDLARSGQNALELLRNYDYGLAIISQRLPGLDGFAILTALRSLKITTPVIILSGIDTAETKLRAFALGADDFMRQPPDMAELVARIQAILRRSNGFAHPIIQVGDLSLDLNSQSVTVKDQILHLTGKEFAVLELLVLRKGIAQTKETFLNHLYGGRDEPDIKIIDVFVCKLRKKLERVGIRNLISTVWGKGYILHEPQPQRLAATVPPVMPLGTVAHASSHPVQALRVVGE